MMFCKYCRHQTRMVVEDPTYKITPKSIQQIRKVKCSECMKFLHKAIKNYKKKTPVGLITGNTTQSQINRLKSERATVDRVVASVFLKPQLRQYIIGTTTMINGNPETKRNSKYEMIEDTPINRRFARYRAFESMYFTNRHGKRLRRTQENEISEKDRAWCNEESRSQPTQDGEMGKLFKHGLEKIEEHTFGMSSKQKVRVCIDVDSRGKETSRDFIPVDISIQENVKDANLDEVKYCGFSKCPNRYAYITRPDKIQKVFAH